MIYIIFILIFCQVFLTVGYIDVLTTRNSLREAEIELGIERDEKSRRKNLISDFTYIGVTSFLLTLLIQVIVDYNSMTVLERIVDLLSKSKNI
jgi:hypothetical protein